MLTRMRSGLPVCVKSLLITSTAIAPFHRRHTSIVGCTYCPVVALHHYLSISKHSTGPLFQFDDGLPITYAFFNDKLRYILRFIGLDSSQYKIHSFRLGAASSACAMGMSELLIRRMGRWNLQVRWISIFAYLFSLRHVANQGHIVLYMFAAVLIGCIHVVQPSWLFAVICHYCTSWRLY